MAKVGNCTVQTIRYYEQIGLLAKPGRTEGNQRIYRQEHRDQLNFIRHSRELGFSLDQIRQILALNDYATHSCEEVDQIAGSHLRDVESKIKRLQDMKKELKRMIGQCAGGLVSDCRIIEVLSDHALCLSEEHGKSFG
ncbi:MAG: DNA-binding transcriptional MerR regulator [Planctomycetota bacterium]|jgi:DNA-binding transcriptional MerR regulator